MKQHLMTCAEERKLGVQLAMTIGAKQTQAAFADSQCSPMRILKTAVAECLQEEGVDAFVSRLLQGPPRWAYIALRYMPDLGSRRDELLSKAAEEPKSAFYTLRYVPQLGDHREALIKGASGDPGWAQMTLRHVPDVDDQRNMLLAAAAPPVEVGWGWNTYYVNQTGQDIWIMYNTGEIGSTGSLSGPVQIFKGQNIGYGRGGGCITETRIFKTEPTGSSPWTDNVAASWSLPFGDNACSNWGYVVAADAAGNFSIPETQSWLSGPGLPGKYPPSSGG